MNLLDYILLIVIAVSVIAAAVRGFFYEIWMMAAAVAAIAVAAWQYPAAARWFQWVGVPAAANFAGFVAVLVLVLILAVIVGRLVRGAMRAVGLGIPDRLLGAGLGLIRGLLLSTVVVLLLTAYPFHPSLVAQSRLAPDFLWGSRALAEVMPAELSARFHRGLFALTATVRQDVR